MPDRMLREGARFSDRIESVSKDAELMFWRMVTVPDDFGIYYADPAQLRAAIWPKNPRNIRITDVTRWRDELARAGILAEFEVEGVRYVELLRFGQAEKLRQPRRRHPAPPREPDDPAQMRIQLSGLIPKEENRREGEGAEKPKPARREAPTPPPAQLCRRAAKPTLSQDEWLADVRARHPGIDIAAELNKAAADRQRKGKTLERGWFESHWLPGCSVAVDLTAGSRPAKALESEPEAWRMYLKDEYAGESWAESAAIYSWPEMPAHWRAKIAAEMATARIN